jgi:hypothetical protein
MKIFVRFSSKSFFTKNIILHYNTTYWFDYQKNQLEDLEIETTPAFGLLGATVWAVSSNIWPFYVSKLALVNQSMFTLVLKNNLKY